MSMPSVQINEDILNRLRNFVASEYGGKVWGKISEHIEIAINDYLVQKEGCKRRFLRKKDKNFYKVDYNGQRGKSLIMLSPIEGTTQRIIIPAEEGYWIKLTVRDASGTEILDNASLYLCKETLTESSSPEYYKYGELKKGMVLKHKILIKPYEKLVIYAEEDIEKIQSIEFEFAVDLCEK